MAGSAWIAELRPHLVRLERCACHHQPQGRTVRPMNDDDPGDPAPSALSRIVITPIVPPPILFPSNFQGIQLDDQNGGELRTEGGLIICFRKFWWYDCGMSKFPAVAEANRHRQVGRKSWPRKMRGVWRNGFRAARRGDSRETCPYVNKWVRGWRRAWLAGYNVGVPRDTRHKKYREAGNG